MRDISQKAFLAVYKARKPVSHAVNGIAQSAKLINPLYRQLDFKVTFGEIWPVARVS